MFQKIVLMVFAVGALWLVPVACSAPVDRFETLMSYSREGRDDETLKLARAILADSQTPEVVQARVEMTVSLAHIRHHRWADARAALSRAKALGIDSDTGYFKDHLAEYEGWIKD